MHLGKAGLLIVAVVLAYSCLAVNNPLSVSLDGPAVRHPEGYAAFGSESGGRVLVSSNLIDWIEGNEVLPETRKGPYELINRNGLFHLYSPNTGYAVSIEPAQSFSVLARTGAWHDDMRLFQDRDGRLVCFLREFGYDDRPGEIHARHYAVPWKPAGSPVVQLVSRLGMWDALDTTGLSTPEVLDYRDHYYLLYTANRPSPRNGQRGIGVAVANDQPDFGIKDIRSNPVLERNAERLERSYKVVLPSGEFGAWQGKYTFKRPGKEWMLPKFAADGWRSGEGGFGHPEDEGEEELIHAVRTKWNEKGIWVRRIFDLPGGRLETPLLKIRHEGVVRVFLNGEEIYKQEVSSPAYRMVELPESVKKRLLTKGNVLAVQAVALPTSKYRFVDFGLYDAGDQPVEPLVYGPDQPRIVEGPNGFEKWMTYRAWWNGVCGTGMDRIFFHNDQLFVDGPTTANTPGYHPHPAQPTFSSASLQRLDAKGTATTLLEQKPARNYLFETWLRMPPTKGRAGIVACASGKRRLVIWLDFAEREWGYSAGSGRGKNFRLPKQFADIEAPSGFKRSELPWHRLRITKNGGNFDVWLDGFHLTKKKPITTKMTGAGVPGLYCCDTGAEFNGVVYTVGWDEFGRRIAGWGSATCGTPSGGNWVHQREAGLEQQQRTGPGRAFKGDLLDHYEFTVTATTDGLDDREGAQYGVFPVFVDQQNYLKAMIDTRARQLVVSGRRNGKKLGPLTASLARRIPVRHLADEEALRESPPNGSYQDVSTWIYRLPSPSLITGMKARWMVGQNRFLKQDFYIPSDEIIIGYGLLKPEAKTAVWDGGTLMEADMPKPEKQHAGMLNDFNIREVKGNHVALGSLASSSWEVVINSDTGEFIREYEPGGVLGENEELRDYGTGGDNNFRPQEVLVSVEVESEYFFRCVKLKDRVIIELNGRPMLEMPGAWPPSQVGLVTDGQSCFFNGMTLMHLPE